MANPIILRVPTVNDELADYRRLFWLYSQVKAKETQNFTLNFSSCNFIRSAGVVFLAGLVSLIKHSNGTVDLDLGSLSSEIKEHLTRNNFLSHCGYYDQTVWPKNTVPLRHDLTIKSKDFPFYLQHNWLRKEWFDCSKPLANKIIETVGEIYSNAFDHSHSPIGILTCGQYHPIYQRLDLALLDLGVGIAANVRNFNNNPNLGANEALKWAFGPRNTTKPHWSGGLGLDILQKFITVNDGALKIFSNDGYVRGENRQELEYLSLNYNFVGTLMIFSIKCDEGSYILSGESSF